MAGFIFMLREGPLFFELKVNGRLAPFRTPSDCPTGSEHAKTAERRGNLLFLSKLSSSFQVSRNHKRRKKTARNPKDILIIVLSMLSKSRTTAFKTPCFMVFLIWITDKLPTEAKRKNKIM